MSHLALLILFVATIEIVVRLKLFSVLSSLLTVLRKAGRVLVSSNISEHWKEKALLAYSAKLMGSCLRLFIILSIVMICFLGSDLIYPGTLAYLTTFPGILASVMLGYAWLWARNFFVNKQ